MNRLHLEFERMVGYDQNRSRILKEAPAEVGQAVAEFNVQIHRFEDHQRPGKSPNSGRIVVTFRKEQSQNKRDKDFSKFATDYGPGTVVLNYCHVGKPVLDFIYDEDEHVSDANILLKAYGGDFALALSRGPAFRKRFR